jgi:glucokinase
MRRHEAASHYIITRRVTGIERQCSMTAYVLSGDCGVTNTRLSLWSIPAGCVLGQGKPAPGELVLAKKYALSGKYYTTKANHGLCEYFRFRTVTLQRMHRYLNEQYEQFIDIVGDFLRESKNQPEAACLACAGPVENDMITFSRLAAAGQADGWTIGARQLETEFGIRMSFQVGQT